MKIKIIEPIKANEDGTSIVRIIEGYIDDEEIREIIKDEINKAAEIEIPEERLKALEF